MGVSVDGCASWGLHSHSVVPGGLEVRSYMTLEIPGIFLISFTIFSTTCGQRQQTSYTTSAEMGGGGTYLLWDMAARRGGDARHEVAGDEGADDHRAAAGRLLLQRVTVKVQRGQDDGHLADLPRVTWDRKYRLL